MNQILDLYVKGSSFGDILGMTPIMNSTPATLHISEKQTFDNYVTLFYGIGNVRYAPENNRSTNQEIQGNSVHFTRKILDHYGFMRYSCIPRIKLTIKEIEFAVNWIKKYQNPVVFKDSCSTPCSRNMPDGMMQEIIDLNPHFTFICFRKKNLQEPMLQRAVYVEDMPVRAVACLYYVIGKYVGVDTGNLHLMLSVNGSCDCFIPENGREGYDYRMHLYPKDAFDGEKNRLNYIPMFSKFKNSILGLKYKV